MTVYIDLLFVLNFVYDFLLLMTVSVSLKRNVKIKRIVIGSFIGALSTLLIFIKINKYLLLVIKIVFGIFLVMCTYGYKSIKYTINNIVYLYMCSVILAGFLYFLKIEFNNFSYVIILGIAPVILYLYVSEQKKLKEIINFNKKVIITFKNNKTLGLNGFIDSGNRLRDPVTGKYIILINKKRLKGIYNIRSPMYVVVNTVNSSSLLECIAIKEIMIDRKVYTNYLLGLSDSFQTNEDFECLLNYHLLEE